MAKLGLGRQGVERPLLRWQGLGGGRAIAAVKLGLGEMRTVTADTKIVKLRSSGWVCVCVSVTKLGSGRLGFSWVPPLVIY